ncbi:fungal-specific transcription factor domain-containing protein [Scheffersomyces xylosifermentans]|uniref:fungal-specific transcription factor domain-containing protein n=1 Tax=Scheffersomyces xylosifermentans TaxID=1304137 RepID=UPI00315CAC67
MYPPHLLSSARDSHDNFGGATHEFDQSPNNYLDSNWASSLLMDPGSDMLYNIDLPSGPLPHTSSLGAGNTNSIIQNIQYQNSIHPEGSITGSNYESSNSQLLQEANQIKEDTQSNYNNKINSQLSTNGPGNNGFQSTGATNSSASTPNVPKTTKQRRPCDHCRRRKTKCVIIPDTNNCVQCEAKSLTCTYTSSAVKRKPLDVDNGPMSKRKMDRKDEPLANPNLTLLQNDQSIIVAPNVPIRDVAPIQDYSVINNSLLKKTLSLQFPRSSFYVGPTSYLFDINLLNLIIDSQNNSNATSSDGNSRGVSPNSASVGKIGQINLSSTLSLRKVSEKAQFVLKDDQSPQSYQTMSNDVDTIEKFIAPHGQILIDLYFRIIHPSYPILHKKVFLEKYSRTHREFSAPLLAAVYVLAIQWWDYDPQLNKFPKPNVELILKIGLNNYFLEILKRPKLSAVQAGLLLLQCKHIIQSTKIANSNNTIGNQGTGANPGNASIGDTDYSEWVLCSQVVALAEELGLGLDCNNWKLPKWERGLRKRLAWAVYMEDKWLSLKHSRPTHINERNWVVVSLLEEDFPEKHGDGDLKEGSSDIDNGKKIFVNLIELSMILSDIIDQFYSMRAMIDITEVNQVLKLAKPLQLKLRTWYHSLPIELQMSSVQPRKLCSNGYLQLAYFATELTLHRKIATVIYQQVLVGNPPPKELITTRLLASIEFVRDLKPEHIHSFWHSSSSSNFTLIGTFAAILFMSSPTKEEADFYRDQIYNYRWILKISSKGFDQVGEALSKLDLVLNHIPELLNDGIDMPMVVPNVPTVDYQRLNQQRQPVPPSSVHNGPYGPHPNPQQYSGGESGIYTSNSNNSNNINSSSGGLNSQRMRAPAQQFRANNQPIQGNSPYSSPQTYSNPPYNQNQGAYQGSNSPNQQTISRGGQFIPRQPSGIASRSNSNTNELVETSLNSSNSPNRRNSRVNSPHDNRNSSRNFSSATVPDNERVK